MKTLQIADLFCGAGGSSTGACEAAAILGFLPKLTVVNHWDRAIETHKANHPTARHYCTGVDNINPRELYTDGKLDVLVASPECTHFSTARGGRPVNEQSRATAMCVIRWAEALRPPVIIIENVPEFRTWGPVANKRVNGAIHLVPDPKKRGELFEAWLNMMRAIGYKVDHRVICCANYGDPTTRKRLFVQCVLGRRKIVWPTPTHLENPGSELELNGKSQKWATARNSVIDWSLQGKSIYERKKALSPKTMARIMAGLHKFGLKPFIAPNFGERQSQEPRTHDVDAPAPTVTSRGAGNLIEPFVISAGGPICPARTVDKPLGTVLTRDHRALVEPFLVNMKGKSKGVDVDKPAPTVTAGAQHLMLAEPYLLKFGERKANGNSVDEPLHTVTAGGVQQAVIQPCLIKLRGTGKAADVDKPAPTVCGSGGHIALAEFVVGVGGPVGSARPQSVDGPLNTVLAEDRRGIASPFLVQVNHGNAKGERDGNNRRVKSVDEPLGAVCGESPEWAVVEPDPFLVQLSHQDADTLEAHRRRSVSVDSPHPTVCGNRGDFALCEPSLLPQQSGGVLRSVDAPAPTIATDGAVALIEPYLVKFYGTGKGASVDTPLDTVTAKDRFGLARPVLEINGQHYQLDIRFRMLQPHELAAAQGFKKGYQFTGNKTEIVKMIGNAVPRRTIRALVLAAVNQDPDVSFLLTEENAA